MVAQFAQIKKVDFIHLSNKAISSIRNCISCIDGRIKIGQIYVGLNRVIEDALRWLLYSHCCTPMISFFFIQFIDYICISS